MAQIQEHGCSGLSSCGDACAKEVADQATQDVQRLGGNCCLALGGGSAIGLAKAIALETHLPIIAIRTDFCR